MPEKAGSGSCKFTLGFLHMMGLTLPGGSACTPAQFQPFLLGKNLLTPKGEKTRRKIAQKYRSKSFTASSLQYLPLCRGVALWGGHYLTWARWRLSWLCWQGLEDVVGFQTPCHRVLFLPGVPKRSSWPPSPFSPPSSSTSIPARIARVAQNSAHPRSAVIWTCRNGTHQGSWGVVLHLLPPAPLSFSTKVERDSFSLISSFDFLQKSCVCFSKSQNHSQPQFQINVSDCGQKFREGLRKESRKKDRNYIYKVTTDSFALSCCLWVTVICRMP